MNLQDQLSNVQMNLLAEKANGQTKNQDIINELEAQEVSLLQQIMEAQNKQNLEEKVEEHVKENGYVLDTMEVDGLTMPEIITDDWQYNQARKGVQIAIVGQANTFSQLIEGLKVQHEIESKEWIKRATEAEKKAEQLQTTNSELEVKNYQLVIENDDLSNKVTKGSDLLNDATSQIEQQKKHIEDLRDQLALGIRGALNIVPEPQDTSKMKAEIDANKPRITDVRYKDEFGIDRRTKTAVEVLTGKEIEYQEYVEKRYIILTLEEAAQYRIEMEQKKAEEEAQNAVIPTQEEQTIEPVKNPVWELEAATEEQTFQTESGHELGNGLPLDREHIGDEVSEDAKEDQVITLESLKAEVDAIKSHLGLVA